MKFEIGDKVKVSDDLYILIDGDCDLDIVEDMLEFAGREAEITDTAGDNYFIDIDCGMFFWHEELLTEVEA